MSDIPIEPRIEAIDIEEEVKRSYLDYAMSVIVGRALPDVRDGLKPVHRRILHAMNDMGVRPGTPFKKSARVVGECFVEGTLVHTPDGLRPIEDLDVGDAVLDAAGSPTTVVGCFANPPGAVVDVAFEGGHTMRVTPGQLFRVLNDDLSVEWVRADRLEGRRVLGSAGIAAPQADTRSFASLEAYVLGLVAAEGFAVDRRRAADGRVRIGMTDREPLEACSAWAIEAGVNAVFSKRTFNDPKRRDIHQLTFARNDMLLEAATPKSGAKRVGAALLADRTRWAPFLAGYFDGDGYVRKDRREIVFVTTSEALRGQIRAIATALGIHGKTWTRASARAGHAPLLGLTFVGSAAVELARTIAPFVRILAKHEGLAALIERGHSATGDRSDLIPLAPIVDALSSAHRGGGWYRAADGTSFRMRSDPAGSPEVRYGTDRLGRVLRDRSMSRSRLVRDGWVAKLRRIGSPLADRIAALAPHAIHAVESVRPVAETVATYDVQVSSEDHSFLVEGAVVHNCMGKYHPHGDQAIYDALARMAQDFAMRAPLVQGHGNFGSVDGDPPAAQRYCVTGDTLVRTIDGTKRIRDLVPDAPANSDTPVDLKLVNRVGDPVRATMFFHSGTHPVLRMKTREGFSLEGTENHPVLCLVAIEGVPLFQWKMLAEVAPGDRVAMLRREPADQGVLTQREWHLAILAGAMVAEGFASPTRAGFNNLDKDYFDQVLAAFDDVVGGPRYLSSRIIKSGNLLHELDVQKMDAFAASPLAELVGKRSEDKRIPSFVWSANPAFKAAFLRSLFEGDGSSTLGSRASIGISYTSRSEALVQDIQQLLLEFGVVSRLTCTIARGEHRVYISNRRDAWLFATRIGFLERKQARLLEQMTGVPPQSLALSSDHFPFVSDYVRGEKAGRWADREWLAKNNIDRIERWEQRGDEIWSHISNPEVRAVVEPIVESGYYFAEVKEVSAAGNADVYSVRVDSDDHAFITNGFVSHNTECRLAALAMEMLRDIGEETVDFIPNYDGEESEPVVLPARFPNLLVNGSTGIAVGMATNIPPHNLGEVIDATMHLIDNPEASIEDLMKFVKGPDFPTGGIIMGRAGVRQALETGRGSVKVRGKAEIEEGKNGRQRIIITELPYMVSGDRVLSKIAEMVEKKVITGIATTRDSLKNESNRHGLRLVVELKRDAIPQVVLNNIYKHTQLQDSFGVNTLALVDGVPKTLSLVDILTAYVGHQVQVIERRTRYRLRKAEEHAHVLEGLLVAINNLDEVIALIRASADVDTARTGLMERFELSEIQANAILDMMLRRLAALERQKIIDDHTKLQAQIADYKDILAKPERVRAIIKEEMGEIRAKFANERRTAVQADEGEIDLEDLIPDEDVVITITRSGYIKRVNLSVYRTQGRGGKGVRGAKPKEGDIVEHLLTTTAHAYVLFFSSGGKVYRIKAHEIPEKDRTARGISIRNLLPLSGEDTIAAVIDTRDYETHKFLVIATAKGVIKKTEFSAYDSSRRDGIIAVKLREGDAVVQVRATSGDDELILATRKGQSIVFPESEVRAMGRNASGVMGVRVKAEDTVMAFEVVDPNGEFLIVTDNGYGKRTLLTNYPRQHRGGTGVRTVHLTARKGFVAGAMMVRPGNELFLISSNGQVIRIQAKEVRRTGRDAQGVRVMRLDAGETVAAMAPVIADEDDAS